MNSNDDIEINLMEIFYLILDKIWILLVAFVIGASLMKVITNFFMEPIYSSTTKLYIYSLNKVSDLSASFNDLQAGSELTQDYMVVVRSRPVVEQVIQNLGIDMKYEGMLGCMNINNPSDTRILEITINYMDAYLAKEIVDEFAEVSAKRMAEIMDIKEPSIIEQGHVAENQTSPKVLKNIFIGGILAMAFVVAIILIGYVMNDTIKSSEDIEKYLGLNTIGVIPIEEGCLTKVKK